MRSTTDTDAQAVKPDPCCSWQGHFGRVGADVGDESTESHCVLQQLRIPSVIRPERRTSVGEDGRCLHVALPLRHFMLTKPVATRATTATCSGCFRRGLGRKTPFSRRGNVPAAEDD